MYKKPRLIFTPEQKSECLVLEQAQSGYYAQHQTHLTKSRLTTPAHRASYWMLSQSGSGRYPSENPAVPAPQKVEWHWVQHR